MTAAVSPVSLSGASRVVEAASLAADVAVIGAGPAGIAAAVRAAESGRRVIVVDESPNAGGQIWRHRARAPLDTDARRWIDRLSRSGAEVHHGISVADIVHAGTDGGFAIVGERHVGGAVVVTAANVVIATGARERFVPFPGWTLPGVYGIGGAQALLKNGATFRGKRVVIAGTGPLILPVAASMSSAGADVRLVAEQASFSAVRNFALTLLSQPDTLLQAAMYRLAFARTPYAMGSWVTAAAGTDRLTSVTVTDGRSTHTIACDVLCTGYGLVPNVEAARLLGCTVVAGAAVVDGRQQTTVANVFAAGEVTGIGGVALSLVEGEIAGACAAGAARPDMRLARRRSALRDMAARMDRAFSVRAEIRSLATADTIVCRCEDVPRGAIGHLRDARQAKLYTRAGMGACQGRVCGPALEFLYGWAPGTVRVPLEPVRLSTVAASASLLTSSPTPSATAPSPSGS
ncbi:MAG TPA: FAD/NAD(P)-binding oxidoreductase [Gemmatimonadaceae bacterium]|nr:FAD/NAD(P)-binding oxidoreductase [Gemmatimonadaceae bacterium]